MCGIAGFVGSFDSASLAAANVCQAHRGPDDAGEFYAAEHGVGLAHVRLAIQDLSPLGHQPMHSADGTCVLVFNGEIYNFRELRAELERAGATLMGHSDTEVLLELYRREGAAILHRLNGIFAFAVWDEARRELFIARDALGVKPLYYAEVDEGFAFASELATILHLVPGAREIDAAALHRYLSFVWNPGDATPLRAVRRLHPGEFMRVANGRILARETWYTLPVFRIGRQAGMSEAQAIAETTRLVRQAVERQLVSDVPVGAFLSGGLDSSAVVAFARESVPGIRCFTIGFADGAEPGMTEDLPYAEQVAAHLGVPLDVVTIDAASMADHLESMVVQLGEPLADPAALNVLYISRLARENGIKVLLSGAGGDDIFSGYRRHVALNFEAMWRWLPRAARTGLERFGKRLDQRNPVLRRMARVFEGASLEGDERIAGYFRWIAESELYDLYSDELRAELKSIRAVAPMLEFMRSLPPTTSPLERMLALEQRFFLADHNLAYTDRMSMATGVEVRVPFLDLDLVEFAARIPARFKQRGREGKWIFKKSMEPFLPRNVIYRPKTGFAAPVRRWITSDLRPLVDEVLAPAAIRERGLFDPSAVQRLIARNQAGQIDASYTILGLLCIELWCRNFADAARIPAPVL